MYMTVPGNTQQGKNTQSGREFMKIENNKGPQNHALLWLSGG